MKIYNTEVHGLESTARAMRNPMNSWSKSDAWGDSDKDLLRRLVRAGTDHRKAVRLIQCWATVEAPRYWWTEFDTYKVGVTRMSCSTMYTLCKRPLEDTDFAPGVSRATIKDLNDMIARYSTCEAAQKNGLLRKIKANLPEGFIQRADVVCSYEALININRGRKGHRLAEWTIFRQWIATLPLMDVILEDA